MANNNPSINPANNNSLVGTIQFAISQVLKNTDGMLPARVIKYDRETNRVQVQLLITMIGTDQQQVPRAQIASLPVLIMGGGNYSISFPINSGDLGWVLANDRDISLFLQTYEQAPPNTKQVKSFSNGLFIPDAMKSYNIDDSNEDYLIIQSKDGLTTIEMGVNPDTGANEINITADRINMALTNTATGLVTIDGNLDVSGVITSPVPVVTAPIIPFPPIYPP